MFIITYRNWFFALAALLVGGSLVAVAIFGIRPSIEFTGGTLVELGYPDGRADKAGLEAKLDALNLGAYSLRPFGEDAYLLRVRQLSEAERNAVMAAATLDGAAKPELRRQNTIGPTIGGELKNKAFAALGTVMLLTILYVAFAFRHVSEPVSSWKYGLISIITLLHDIIVPMGVFAIAGHFLGTAEADILFVTALLTILGYSVNDTIVIFDRIRENLKANIDDEAEEDFNIVVGRSLEQTFVRSFNTSITVLVVVVSILLFGGSATFYFALALTAGVIAGTYSSLFLAAPLLVVANNMRKSNAEVQAVARKSDSRGK